MNEKLINSILKIALSVKFPKKLKLKKEEGVTRYSIENLDKILKNYDLMKATFHFDKNNPKLHTEWIDKNGEEIFSWDFKGFNAGYGGEGPRGLATALKKMQIQNWDFDKIVNLKPGTYSIEE